MDWMEIAAELYDPLREGDLDFCIDHVIGKLRQLPASPYHLVLDLVFMNDPVEVARHFDQFVAESKADSSLKAIYTEVNGFYSNPDRWFFELFGLPTYGGHERYDWLADWSARYDHEMTLTGMESLQSVYERFKYDGQHGKVKGICDLLVVLRFQSLIQRSAVHMTRVEVPVLATVHDYDFIYEVAPTRKPD